MFRRVRYFLEMRGTHSGDAWSLPNVLLRNDSQVVTTGKLTWSLETLRVVIRCLPLLCLESLALLTLGFPSIWSIVAQLPLLYLVFWWPMTNRFGPESRVYIPKPNPYLDIYQSPTTRFLVSTRAESTENY